MDQEPPVHPGEKAILNPLLKIPSATYLRGPFALLNMYFCFPVTIVGDSGAFSEGPHFQVLPDPARIELAAKQCAEANAFP